MDNSVPKLARLDRRERGNESVHEDRSASAPSKTAVSKTAASSAAATPDTATSSAAASNPGAVPPVAREPAAASAAAGLEPRTVGFTSAIGHLSLYGWLRWIHANRSDATLRVHTDEGSGNIWCGAGEIIDAEWEGRFAEDALAQMLPCSSGAVTIDFDPVQRPRRVDTPTPQLLHVTDAGPAAGGAQAAQLPAQPAPPPGAAPRKDRFAELALLLAESIAPVAGTTSQPPRAPPKRAWRSGYVAGALVVAALAVAGFAVGRLRATSGLARSSATEQTPASVSRPAAAPSAAPASASEPPIVTPKPRELSPIPFVSIEVEPTHAEIWLDRELVGRGALQLAAIQDGVLHELRFTAPEHETKTLFFRNAPPAGRVLLAHVSERDVSERGVSERDGPATQAVIGAGAAAAPKRVTRQRSASSSAAPSRARAASAEASAPIKAPTSRTPRIELIEVQTPRVQVLD